jgi:hypothetical protein
MLFLGIGNGDWELASCPIKVRKVNSRINLDKRWTRKYYPHLAKNILLLDKTYTSKNNLMYIY